MHLGSRLIERYIVKAILPYLLLSVLLLTSILFAQQASHFAELLLEANIPLSLVWQVALALIPNALLFALPIAMLAGAITGFSRLGSDSELTAMRAAGVGTWSLLWPILLMGLLLSFVTLYLSLEESPRAARSLRRAALRAALYKLDSPVEPRSINTDIPGYVVYVRDGDKTQGQWGRVFIYTSEKDGSNRLITARSGRIDSAAEQSELVLNDAIATKLPATGPSGEPSKAQENTYVLERLAQLRVQFNTGRAALLARLRQDEREPDEMDWQSLAAYAETKRGAERRDAATLLQKRLTLSVTAFVFALLGTGLGLRIRKGGRGLGLLISLLVLIGYYLFSILGEQMARAGTVTVYAGAWLSTALALIFGLVLLAFGQRSLWGGLRSLRFMIWQRKSGDTKTQKGTSWVKRTRLLSFPSLMDLGVLRNLLLGFVFGISTLTAIFLIFTLFELWRFIALNGPGARLIMMYMLYLLPLITIQLTPASLLLAILATYALMARRSEAIAWWACGQSTYRLMLPGLFLAAIIGCGIWFVQESLMPGANIQQDALRAQIRGGVLRTSSGTGKQWLAAPENGRLYAYEYDDETGTLKEPAIYEFDAEGVHLRRAIQGETAEWAGPGELRINGAETIDFLPSQVVRRAETQTTVSGVEPPRMFKPTLDKPSQLSAKRLSTYIKQMKRQGSETASFAVALQRKYAEPFSALVMALIAIPLAFSYGRRSALAALCSAVGVGMAFWGLGGGFQQLGSYGLLPPTVAAWAPLLIFASLGVYLLSRTRT